MVADEFHTYISRHTETPNALSFDDFLISFGPYIKTSPTILSTYVLFLVTIAQERSSLSPSICNIAGIKSTTCLHEEEC
jgi:hypothetical protein